MKFDCQLFHEHFSEWMDSELDIDTSHKMQQHVGNCEFCSQELAEFQSIDQLARSLPGELSCPPSWDLIEKRIINREGAQISNQYQSGLESHDRTFPQSRSRKASLGMLFAVTASVILMVSLWRLNQTDSGSPDKVPEEFAIKKVLDLQTVIEQFQHDPQASLNTLNDHYEVKEFSLDAADSNFGRSTYVSTVLRDRDLPGFAQPEATKLLSLPSCHCPKGECTCGESGCNCIVSICQRPDGSIYLVFEQCRTQMVEFGNLPVEVVKRDGFEFQEIHVGTTRAISFNWSTGKVVVVGLRNEAEVELLFANN